MNTTALTTIAGDINYQHEQAEAKAQEAIGHVLEAGRLLAEAKAQVQHGQWADWLASNFKGSNRTAQAYMRLANNREAIEAKTQSSAHLSINGALKLLAEPKEETGREYCIRLFNESWSSDPAGARAEFTDEEKAEIGLGIAIADRIRVADKRLHLSGFCDPDDCLVCDEQRKHEPSTTGV